MCLMGNNVSRCLVAVCANQFVLGSTRLFLKLRKFNSIKWIAFLAYMMFGLRSNRMEKVSRFGFRWVFSSVVRIFGWLNLQFIPLVRYCAELVNLYLIWKLVIWKIKRCYTVVENRWLLFIHIEWRTCINR